MKMTKMFTFDHLVTDGVYLYLVYLSTYSLRVLKPALPRNYKSSVNNFHFQLLKLFLMLIVAFALNGENTHASSIPADQPQAYRSTPQLVSYTSKIISEATVSHNTEFSKISDSKSLGHFSSSVSMRYTSIQDVDSIISVSSSIRSCSVNKETHLYSINTEPLSPAFNSDVELKTISSTKPSFNTPSNIRFQVTAMLTPYSSSLSSGATFFQGFKSIAQFLASSILPSAPTPSNDNRNEIRNRETPSISKFGLQSMLSRWTTIPISEPTAGSEYTSELFVSNTIKYRSDRNLNFSHYIFGPTSSSLPGSMISSSKIFTTIYIESVSFKVYTFLSARFEASFSKSKQSFLAFSSAVSSRMPSFESATSLFSVKDTYKEDFSYKSEISALTKVMLVSDSIDTSETIKPSYRLHESTYSKMVEYWKVDSSVAQSLLSSSSDILSVPQEIKTRVYTSDSDLVQNNASATKVRSIHYDPLQSLYIETNLTESLLGQFGHPRSETQGMSLGKTQKSLATTYGMKAPTNTFSGIVNSLEHSSKSFTERPSTMSYNISLAFALNTQTVYLIHAKVSKYPSLLPLNENAMHTDSSTTPLQSQELKTYFSGHTSKAKHIDSSFTVGLFSTKSSERIPVSGSLKPVISITNFITKYDSVVPFFTSAFMEHGPSYKSANKTLIPKYETVPGASILGSTTLRDIFYSSLQFSTPVNDISSTENFLPNSALLSAKSVVLPSSYVTKQSQSMLSNTSVAEDNVDMKYLTMSSSQESMYMTTTFATRMYLQTTQIVSSAIQNSLTYHSISNYLQKNNLPISIRGKEKSSLSIDSLAISSGYKESGSVPYFVITYLNVKNDVTPHVRTPSISNQTVGIESSYDRNTESVNNIGPKSSFQRSFTDTNDLKDLKISPTPGILTYESADFNTPYLTSNSFPSRMTEGSLNDRISLMTPDTSFTLKRKSENNQILVTSKTPNLGMYFSNISPEISLSSSRAAKDNFQDNVESFSPMQTKLHMSDFLIAFSGKSNLSPNYIFPSTEGLTPSLKVDLKSQGEISSSILEGNLLSSNLNLPAYKTTFVRTVYPSITHHSTEGIFHKSLTSIEKITIDPTVTMNAKEASFTRYKNSENNVADTSFLAYQWHSNSRVDLLFNQTFSNADPSFIDRNTKSVNNIGPKSSFQRSFTDNNDLKWLKISPTPGILTHESANFNTPYLTSNSFPSRMTEGRLNDRISLMTPETSFTLKRKSENNPILVTSKTPNLGMYFSNISPEISLSSSRAAKDNIQDNVESFSPMQTKLHMSDFLIAFSGKSNLSPNYIFPSTEGLTPSLKVDLKSQGEISSSILEGNLLSSNLNLPAYKTIFLSTVYLSITRYSTEGIFHKSLTGIEKITIDPTVTMKAKEASFTQDNNSENNVADTSFLTYQWHSNSRVDFLFNQTSSNADPSFIDRNTKSVNNIGPKSSFQRSFTDNNDLKGLKISPTPGILTYESAHFDTPYLTSNSFPSRMTEGRLNGRISLMTPETSFTLKPKSENNPILVTSKTPNLGMYFSNISPEISLSSSTKEDNFQDNVESFSPLQTKLHMSDFLIAFSGNSNLSPNYIFPSTEGLTQSSKVNLKSQGEISSSILEGNLLSSNLNLPAYKTTFLSTVYPSITHYSTEGIFHKSLTGIEKITIDPTVTMKVKGASFTQDKNSENHVADTSFLTYQWHSNSRIDLLFNQPFSNADPSSIASKSHQITSKVKQESSALQNVYLREQTRPQSSNYLNHFETSYRPVNTLSNLASSKLSKDSFDVSANSFQTSRVYYNAILSVPALPFSASINNLKNEKLSSALNGVGYVTITSSFIHFPLNSVVSNSAEDFFLNRSPHTYESSISSFDKQFSSFTSNNLQYFSMHDTSKPLSINNNPTQQKDNSDSISVALASDFLLVKSINFGNTLVKFVNLSPNFKLSSIISTFTKENYWSLKENNLHSSARIESLTDPYFKPQSSVHFGGSIEHLTSSLSVTIPKNSLLSGHSDDGFMFSKKISHTKYEEYSNLISTYLESLAYSEIKRTSLMMSLQLQESYSIEYYRVTGSASKLRMSEKASVLPSPYVASELETRKSLSEGNPLSIATKLITPTFYSPLTQVHLSHNHKMQSAPEQFSKLETGQITLTVMSPSKSFSTAVGDSPMKTMTKNILHHNSYSVQPTEAPFSFLSTKVSDKDQLISVTNLRKRTVNEISDTKILDSKLNYESAQMTFSTSNAYHLELFSSIKLSSVQNMNFPSMQKTEYIFEAISGVNLLSQTSMSQVYISEEATNYISSSYTANHLLPSETRPDLTIFSYKPHLYSSLFASYHQTSGDLEDILTDPSKYLDIPTKLGTSTSTEYPGLSFNLNQGTPFFVTSATSLSSYYRITTSLKNTKPNLMKSIQSSIVFNSNSPSPGSDIAGQVEDILTTTKFISLSMSKEKQTISSFYYQNINTINTIKSVEIPEIIHSFLILSSSGYDSNYLANSSLRLTNFPRPKTSSDDEKSQHLPYTKSHQSYKLQNSDWEISAHFTTAITKNIPPEKGIISKSAPAFNTLSATQSFHPSSKELADRITTLKVSSSTEKLGLERHTDVQPMQTSAVSFSPTMTTKLTTNEVIAGISQFSSLKTQTSSGSNICTTQMKIIAPSPSSTFATKLFSKTAMSTVPMLHSNAFMLPKNTVYDMRSSGDSFLVQKMHHSISPSDQIVATPSLTSFVSFHSISVVSLYFSQMSLIKEDSNQLTPGTTASIFPIFSEYSKGNFKSKALSVESVLMSTFRSEKYNRHSSTAMFPESVWDEHSTKDVVFSAYLQKTFRPTGVLFQDTFTTVSSKITTTIMDSSFRTTDSVALHGSALLTFKHSAYSSFIHKSHSVMHLAISSTRANEAQSMLPGLGDTKQKSIITINMPPTGTSNKVPVSSDDFHYIFSEGQEVFSASPTVFTSISKTIDPNPETQRDITMDQISFKTQQFIITAVSNSIDSSPTSANEMFTDTISLETSNMLRQLTTRYSLYPGLPSSLWLVGYPVLFTDMSKDYASSHLPNRETDQTLQVSQVGLPRTQNIAYSSKFMENFLRGISVSVSKTYSNTEDQASSLSESTVKIGSVISSKSSDSTYQIKKVTSVFNYAYSTPDTTSKKHPASTSGSHISSIASYQGKTSPSTVDISSLKSSISILQPSIKHSSIMKDHENGETIDSSASSSMETSTSVQSFGKNDFTTTLNSFPMSRMSDKIQYFPYSVPTFSIQQSINIKKYLISSALLSFGSKLEETIYTAYLGLHPHISNVFTSKLDSTMQLVFNRVHYSKRSLQSSNPELKSTDNAIVDIKSSTPSITDNVLESKMNVFTTNSFTLPSLQVKANVRNNAGSSTPFDLIIKSAFENADSFVSRTFRLQSTFFSTILHSVGRETISTWTHPSTVTSEKVMTVAREDSRTKYLSESGTFANKVIPRTSVSHTTSGLRQSVSAEYFHAKYSNPLSGMISPNSKLEHEMLSFPESHHIVSLDITKIAEMTPKSDSLVLLTSFSDLVKQGSESWIQEVERPWKTSSQMLIHSEHSLVSAGEKSHSTKLIGGSDNIISITLSHLPISFPSLNSKHSFLMSSFETNTDSTAPQQTDDGYRGSSNVPRIPSLTASGHSKINLLKISFISSELPPQMSSYHQNGVTSTRSTDYKVTEKTQSSRLIIVNRSSLSMFSLTMSQVTQIRDINERASIILYHTKSLLPAGSSAIYPKYLNSGEVQKSNTIMGKILAKSVISKLYRIFPSFQSHTASESTQTATQKLDATEYLNFHISSLPLPTQVVSTIFPSSSGKSNPPTVSNSILDIKFSIKSELPIHHFKSSPKQDIEVQVTGSASRTHYDQETSVVYEKPTTARIKSGKTAFSSPVMMLNDELKNVFKGTSVNNFTSNTASTANEYASQLRSQNKMNHVWQETSIIFTDALTMDTQMLLSSSSLLDTSVLPSKHLVVHHSMQNSIAQTSARHTLIASKSVPFHTTKTVSSEILQQLLLTSTKKNSLAEVDTAVKENQTNSISQTIGKEFSSDKISSGSSSETEKLENINSYKLSTSVKSAHSLFHNSALNRLTGSKNWKYLQMSSFSNDGQSLSHRSVQYANNGYHSVESVVKKIEHSSIPFQGPSTEVLEGDASNNHVLSTNVLTASTTDKDGSSTREKKTRIILLGVGDKSSANRFTSDCISSDKPDIIYSRMFSSSATFGYSLPHELSIAQIAPYESMKYSRITFFSRQSHFTPRGSIHLSESIPYSQKIEAREIISSHTSFGQPIISVKQDGAWVSSKRKTLSSKEHSIKSIYAFSFMQKPSETLSKHVQTILETPSLNLHYAKHLTKITEGNTPTKQHLSSLSVVARNGENHRHRSYSVNGIHNEYGSSRTNTEVLSGYMSISRSAGGRSKSFFGRDTSYMPGISNRGVNTIIITERTVPAESKSSFGVNNVRHSLVSASNYILKAMPSITPINQLLQISSAAKSSKYYSILHTSKQQNLHKTIENSFSVFKTSRTSSIESKVSDINLTTSHGRFAYLITSALILRRSSPVPNVNAALSLHTANWRVSSIIESKIFSSQGLPEDGFSSSASTNPGKIVMILI